MGHWHCAAGLAGTISASEAVSPPLPLRPALSAHHACVMPPALPNPEFAGLVGPWLRRPMRPLRVKSNLLC